MACTVSKKHSRDTLKTYAYAMGAMTKHATRRSQQRAIRPVVLALLLEHGVRKPAGGGSEMIYLPRRRHAELLAEGICTDDDRLKGIYAIISADDQIVTVGHRTRRLWR
ncbi:hypothetical protein CFR73_09270 [Novacetimonas maltaceti]|uniref:DUF4258 domain-containing protein n=1 Tax=Novacetimonas maltaceti TaxID=1203393 RepID=A0A2S3W2B3_9PROT|nr:hypothetical protein [Novacetimonas maltaceti]POF63044.1 hypothetical protein KMAL_12820 [Novacetimonas maltaceti]PYD59941.1 hypothetical protein CFR73_09270 [Novacetimonas maltaceti]